MEIGVSIGPYIGDIDISRVGINETNDNCRLHVRQFKESIKYENEDKDYFGRRIIFLHSVYRIILYHMIYFTQKYPSTFT